MSGILRKEVFCSILHQLPPTLTISNQHRIIYLMTQDNRYQRLRVDIHLISKFIAVRNDHVFFMLKSFLRNYFANKRIQENLLNITSAWPRFMPKKKEIRVVHFTWQRKLRQFVPKAQNNFSQTTKGWNPFLICS